MKIIKFTEVSNELKNDWERLWKNSGFANIVNSPAWTLAAHKAYGYKKLQIIAVYDDQETNMLAVVAFVKEKIFGISVWTVPGIEFSDKCSILANFDDENILRFLVSEIAELGFVYLPYCTGDEIQKMRECVPQSAVLKSDVNLYIDFSKGKYGKYSNKKRKNLLNRIENTQTQLDFVITNYAKDDKTLQLCFEIDIASAKQFKGKGVFYKSNARELYTKLAELLPENIPLSILYLNKKPVSYMIGFLVNNTYSSSQKAFLKGFEYYNPGKLALIKLIDHYEKKGLPAMEFGRGDDRFKHNFTSSYHLLYNLVISQSMPLRLYIAVMYAFRKKAYEYINGHRVLYLTYKKIKDKVSFFNAN